MWTQHPLQLEAPAQFGMACKGRWSALAGVLATYLPPWTVKTAKTGEMGVQVEWVVQAVWMVESEGMVQTGAVR